MKNKLKTSNLNKIRYGLTLDWSVRAPFLYYKRNFSQFLTVRGAVEGLGSHNLLKSLSEKGALFPIRVFVKYLTLLFNKHLAGSLVRRVGAYRRLVWLGRESHSEESYERSYRADLIERMNNVALVGIRVLNFQVYHYFNISYLDVFFLMPLSSESYSYIDFVNAANVRLRDQKTKFISFRGSKGQLLALAYLRAILEKYLKKTTSISWVVNFYNHYLTPKREIWWGIINRHTSILKPLDTLEQRRTNMIFCAAFNHPSATFLAQHLAQSLSRGSNQKGILKKLTLNLNIALAFGWHIRNVKILLCGKFGVSGTGRTKMHSFVLGPMKVTGQIYNLNISYGFAVADTFTGSIGVHVWITKYSRYPLRYRVKGRGV